MNTGDFIIETRNNSFHRVMRVDSTHNPNSICCKILSCASNTGQLKHIFCYVDRNTTQRARMVYKLADEKAIWKLDS